MRRRVLVIAAAVCVVAVIAVVSVTWPRGATPVTEAEALDDFRSQTTADPTQGTEPTVSGLPTPGVYTYTSSGEEVVKLGVLPAETRPYPETMTVVIVDAEPSCFTATLNLLDQHTEDTTYCLDAAGLRLDSHTKHQSIGAVNPTATMTCDPALLVSQTNDPTELACTLALSGGPAQLTATLTGTTEATETSVGVGDTEVDARLVDVTYAITGDLTGTWHEKTWFAASNWLPLRIERELDLNGLATFTERSTLEITDTEPRR